MHILVTVNAAWNIANFRMPLINAFLDRGFRVTILAPRDQSVAELEARGAKFVDLKMDAKGINPMRDLAFIARLRRHFRDLEPDRILSFTIKNNVFGGIAVRGLGIPFIPNVSGLGTAFLSGNMMQRVAEMLYRRAFKPLDTVFFQNSDDAELFLRCGLVAPKQLRIIPGSGIDLEQFSPAPLPDGPPVFLMIARVLKDKGVLEFVSAARAIKAANPEFRFQLLGAADSENRTAIKIETVKEWHREGCIEYLGSTDDVQPAIKAANCIVLPSYREGAPRTLIEGAAMARPLIATDVPGCRTVVDPGDNGYLVAPKNAEALAEAMMQFSQLSEIDQRKMGTQGRRKMEAEFGYDIVVNAYLDAIECFG